MIKIAEYLKSTPDIQWEYAKQMGIDYAVGRMPDGHMEETAESYERLKDMKEGYDSMELKLKVIEPAPLNHKIKFGLPGRDEEIERMCKLITNMGKLGIEVLCYNFVAHFNWVRTSFDIKERGGAKVTGYKHDDIDHTVITDDGILTKEQLWSNFEYLQKAIVPIAEKANVRLALHPDDPPVDSIQHISRIFTSADAIEKGIELVPSKNMGITLCQGTYCAMGEKITDVIERFGKKNKINFVHFRDITGSKYNFHETFHDNGMTDMAECVIAYNKVGFDGYARVDHVPTLAGEDNNSPGYCSLGRLYAVGYFKGLCEMGEKLREK